MLLHRPVAEDYWREAQIVHCTGESYVPTSRSPLVVTVHDAAYFDLDAHAKSFATYKQQLKWRVLYATLSRTVDAFHTVSHFSADRLGTIFPSILSRLRVIHNEVSPRFFAPPCAAGAEFLQRSGLTDKRYVLLPSGLHYRKNAHLILKAWPVIRVRMPDLTLVIANHCDLYFAAQAASLGKSVVCTGFVDDDDLCALYRGAQLVWFPSRYEGFGMPVLEAMESGTAVVASKSSSIPEVGPCRGVDRSRFGC
jgi:glycosyltransferase involved in cell wall biosynthesis